jgi:S-adenosylhomocysteine hydrolase
MNMNVSINARYKVSIDIDNKVAELKLQTLCIEIDKLSKDQQDYLNEYF